MYFGVYSFITPFLETAKLHILYARYEECKKNAVPINAVTALKLCDTYDRGAYIDGIAYDSSALITNNGESRSAGWWNAALNQENVLFKQLDFHATEIGPHFYYLQFDITQPVPDQVPVWVQKSIIHQE